MKAPAPSPSISRKAVLWWSAIAIAVAAMAGLLQFAPTWSPAKNDKTVTVFKTSTCNCCTKWVEHLRSAGFTVDVHNTSSLASVRARAGVPVPLGSCHTAFAGAYVIEGHVPAQDIRRLLKERPRGRGLAVPGMPIGSPGMEQGDRHDRYEVLLFSGDEQQVFAVHGVP